MMIKDIDRFLNWLLFSLYKMHYYSVLLVFEIIDLLLGRPLYSLPCVKKRLKKLYGFDSFKQWKMYTNDISFSISLTSRHNRCLLYSFSWVLFVLPIYLLLQLCILAFGWSIFRNPIVNTFLSVVPAFILADIVFWKKDRFLVFFAIFEKENRKKKIVWAVGVSFCLLLLIAVNAFLMWCIY